MAKKLLYPVLLSACLVSACSDSNDATSESNPLVVEAYLHVNRPFKITVSNLAGVPSTDVDHFNVSVTSHEGTITLQPAGDGVYTSDDSNVVKDDAGDYTLAIATDSKAISSLTVVPGKPVDFQLSKTEITVEPITFGNGGPPRGGSNESVDLTWSNPSDDYYFTFFQNIDDDPELINTALDTLGGNAPTRFFRGEPIQGNSSTIGSRQFEYYGTYYVILFHVNPDYAALYKEQESSSSLNLTSPFTNVVNGLGIFTAIHSDTVLFKVKKP
jgi:hypothetical protein